MEGGDDEMDVKKMVGTLEFDKQEWCEKWSVNWEEVISDELDRDVYALRGA